MIKKIESWTLELLKPLSLIVFVLLLMGLQNAFAQNSLITVIKDPLKAGNEAYLKGDYAVALKNYLNMVGVESAPKNLSLRIARSYYLLHDYKHSSKWYNKFEEKGEVLPEIDKLYFAESLLSTGSYDGAINQYQSYLNNNSSSSMVSAKIWRINNLSYLFEDSLKNAVHFAEINTPYSEIQAVKYGDKMVYTSNHPKVSIIGKIDRTTNDPFYHLTSAIAKNDPFSIGAYFYSNLKEFGGKLDNNYHFGPISFYDNNSKIVYVSNSTITDKDDFYVLQLFFGELKNGKWIKTGSFPFNSLSYSIAEASISEDGKLLIFSSNKEGGYGGYDLYMSQMKEGEWSEPKNLGDKVNTELNEAFPYFHASGTLYFSSNGHPGLGGLDIFKIKMNKGEFTDLENMGYPVNSSFDDFSFSIDSLKRQGFISSNRANGGLDDDIYEIDLNLQAYPLEVSGTVKYIEHNWMDSTELETLADVELQLIDIASNKVVSKNTTNALGEFEFNIPYYSQYKIRIIGENIEGQVSFEVPKYAKENQKYEIVVVNDDFKRFRE